MRKSGILLPIFSLPGPYGIGSLGAEAYRFVEFLERTNQKIWQVLPLGPISYGNSPYQTFSAFAGNPYFIDLDFLKNENLLNEEELKYLNIINNKDKIDYEFLYNERFKVLKKAFNRFDKNESYDNFIYKNEYWLEDYALFMALKNKYNGLPWYMWEKSIKLRYKKSILKVKEELKEEIEFQKFLQFKFFEHWMNLKKYANSKNISIVGDIPIYVSYDSSDVWANSKYFLLDKFKNPILVSGCPPDAFSNKGQLWGNPVYRWNVLKKSNYDWWIKRISLANDIYDYIRIDHFRGFEAYYTIEYGREDATIGKWLKGPGIDLFNKIKEKLGNVKIIAEDLGFLTEEVYKLLEKTNYPGMKVLQFGFEPYENSTYLPHNYKKNTVCYTGTHDNETLKGWVNNLNSEKKQFLKEYLNVDDDNKLVISLIKLAQMSVSDIVIIPIYDYLELDNYARINTPSTLDNNWIWRLDKNLLTKDIEDKIKYITKLYGRC